MDAYVRVQAVLGVVPDLAPLAASCSGVPVGEAVVCGVRSGVYRFGTVTEAGRFLSAARSRGARASHVAEVALPGYRQSDNDGDEAPPGAVDGPDTDAAYGGGRCPTCGSRAVGRSTDDAVRWCSMGHRHKVSSWAGPNGATTDGMPEAVAQRRSLATRLQANRTARTSMDSKRRHTADIAKRWRSRNRSKVRGYQSVYDRPQAGALRREGVEVADVARVLVERVLMRGPVDEARRKADLDAAFDALRSRTRGWVSEGWDRAHVIAQVDPSFIHHAEHFDRLLHGGVARDGRHFPGGGGLRWGGLVIAEQEALLRVMGSFEYGPVQEVYQQTIRFANYRRIVEAEGFSWPERARMLLLRDSLRVHCSCEAFRFYHQHAATVKGFALYAEDREAPTNNPGDRSGVCKHLNVCLRWLGAQHLQMASEMKAHHEGRRS